MTPFSELLTQTFCFNDLVLNLWISNSLKTRIAFEHLILFIVKMQNIWNLISWKNLYISDIFICYNANINGMWNTRKQGEFFSYSNKLGKLNLWPCEQTNFYKFNFRGFIGTFLVNFATCDKNNHFEKPL